MAGKPATKPGPEPVKANEILRDEITAHAVDLSRFEAGLQSRMLRQLKLLEKKLQGLVGEYAPSEPVRTAYRQARLEKLLAQTKAAIKTAYGQMRAESAKELQALSALEAEFSHQALTAAISAPVSTVAIGPEMAAALANGVLIAGAPTADWWARQAGDLDFRFANEMREGIQNGEGVGELIRRVRGTRAGGFKDGIMRTSTQHAQMLVRSSVQTVANRAGEAVWEANADLLKGVQWVSTLDSRTSVPCMARDGLLYTADTHEPVGHSVSWGSGPGSLHRNCRSKSVPVVKSWRELGIDADEVDPGTRASMDGYVPAATNYEEWLKGKPREFQDRVLGKGKAKLWRDKKLKLADLLIDRGRGELTLEQLAEKVGANHESLTKRIKRQAAERLTIKGRIARQERDIIGLDRENLLVLDRGGKLLGRNTGNKDGVYVPAGVPLKGATVVHNHTRGQSFSLDDFSLLVNNGPAEVRAVTEKYSHTLSLDPAMLPEGFKPTEALEDMKRRYRRLRNEARGRIAKGEITSEQAERTYSHRLWSEAARANPWLVYKREKLKK